MKGKVISVGAEYAMIESKHGKIAVGQRTKQVFQSKVNTFGSHFFGFTPAEYPCESGYVEELPA